MPISKPMLAAATALPLSFFASTAFAAPYALSVNKITQFQMSFNGSANFDGFTFSNDSAASENDGTGSTNSMDAPAACIGDCAGWDNEFSAHTNSNEFSYGDALISDADVLNGDGAASTIGEVNVLDGTGFASGSNTMTSSQFSIDTAGTSIDFSFQSDPLLNTVLGSNGQTAASLNFSITLTDSNDQKVFEWLPDGDVGSGIDGGTESSDPFSLNTGIAGTSTYDPSQNQFAAVTGGLAKGDYNLNISMGSQVNAAVVPVPAAVWLFGSGLLGLVGVARRRAG